MFDTVIRPLITPAFDSIGRALARRGVSANAVTACGLVLGVCAAVAIASQHYAVGLALVVANRVVDGLDGAVARASTPSDYGGYFDIVADYVFYGAIPLAFALAEPAANALAACALLAGFCLTASSFLTFAAIAARRGLTTDDYGRKAFFYSRGLVEGSETIAFFILMAALPAWFATLAWIFTGLCVLTALQRLILARQTFTDSD